MRFATTLAIAWIAAASCAYAQSSSSVNKDGTTPRPDPQPFYTPYSGPGFGNPDAKAREAPPVGQSRKKFHDAAGASAYSKGGNTEVTPLEAPPAKPKRAKKEKPAPKSAGSTAASPPAGEKR